MIMPFIEDVNFEDNAIIFLHHTKVHTQIIYSTTILFILVAFATLPFIYSTVSVKGNGSLQSNIERAELLAQSPGKLP